MAENTDLYLGIDMAFSTDFSASTGDADLASGRKCLIQDLLHRFMTPKGNLQSHPAYGPDIQRFLHAPGSDINQLDLVQSLETEALEDPRVESANVSIVSWDGYKVKFRIVIIPIDGGNAINLVFGYDLSTLSMEVITGG